MRWTVNRAKEYSCGKEAGLDEKLLIQVAHWKDSQMSNLLYANACATHSHLTNSITIRFKGNLTTASGYSCRVSYLTLSL